jgi:hypothetical protein
VVVKVKAITALQLLEQQILVEVAVAPTPLVLMLLKAVVLELL